MEIVRRERRKLHVFEPSLDIWPASIKNPADMAIPNIRSNGWVGADRIQTGSFRCGYCGDQVASEKGYRLSQHHDQSGGPVGYARICPSCNYPTLFLPGGLQIPGEAIGRDVQHVPDEIQGLYREARRAATEGLHTGCVLLCRKLLMNLAVGLGAKHNLKFIEYVEFLADQVTSPHVE